MFRIIARDVSVIVPFLFFGCSTSDFKQPVAAFSAATKVAATSFDDYANSVDKFAQEQNISDVASGRAVVKIPNTDCKLTSKQCRIFISANDGVKPLKSSIVPNVRKIMTGLIAYAGHLEAVATSDSADELKNVIDRSKTNLIDLAKAADTLNAQLGRKTALESKVTAFAPSLTNWLTFALTKYTDEIKLEALREATGRMQTIFPDVAELFVVVGFSDRDIMKANLFDKFKHAESEMDAPPSKQQLKALQAAADAYNASLTGKPGDVFIKLSEAHTALAEALQMPKPSFETVFALIQQIADAAAKLVSDAKAFEKAGA